MLMLVDPAGQHDQQQLPWNTFMVAIVPISRLSESTEIATRHAILNLKDATTYTSDEFLDSTGRQMKSDESQELDWQGLETE